MKKEWLLIKNGIVDSFGTSGNENIGAIGKVASINALIAVVALLKDILLASYLGTTQNADAFLLAFFITDMIGCNLLANGVGTSCVPLFSKLYIAKSVSGIGAGLKKVNLYLLLAVGAAVVAMYVFRTPIIDLLGGGYEDSIKAVTVQLFALLLPTVLVYPIVYAGMAALQVEGRFGTSAFVPVLFNLVFLAGILVCLFFSIPTEQGIYFICIFVLAALAVMAAWTYFSLLGRRADAVLSEPGRDSALEGPSVIHQFLSVFGPYLLMLFLTQGILYYERYLASGYSIGGVAALNYAYRVSQFPVWVFTAAIGTVAFPSMSKQISAKNREASVNTLKKALWLMLLFTVPVTVFLFVLRMPVLSVLFQRQAFDEESLQLTAVILASYSFAIIGQSVTTLCLKYFLSAGRVRGPALIFLGTALLNVLIDSALYERFGLAAFGYGAATASALNAILLLWRLSLFRAKEIGENKIRIRSLVWANLLTIGISLLYLAFWNAALNEWCFLLKLLSLGVAALLCVVAYIVAFLPVLKGRKL